MKALTVLAIVSLLAALLALSGQVETAAAKSNKTAVTAQYITTIEWRDLAQWTKKDEDDCSISESTGSHEINSDSNKDQNSIAPYAWTFQKTFNGSLKTRGYYTNQTGLPAEMKQEGQITLENTDTETSKGCPEPEPIICNDCNSEDPPPPPQKACGTRPFTLTLGAPVDIYGATNKFNFMLNPTVEPADPFYDESGRTFCYSHAAHPMPEIWALDAKENEVSVARSQALKYFSLDKKAQKACKRYVRKLTDPCKASFSIKLKQGANFTREAPNYYSGTQESIINIFFWFAGVCTEKSSKKGVSGSCYMRTKKGWKKADTLPGMPKTQPSYY